MLGRGPIISRKEVNPDLPFDQRRLRVKFGFSCNYSVEMHKEPTNKQASFFIYTAWARYAQRHISLAIHQQRQPTKQWWRSLSLAWFPDEEAQPHFLSDWTLSFYTRRFGHVNYCAYECCLCPDALSVILLALSMLTSAIWNYDALTCTYALLVSRGSYISWRAMNDRHNWSDGRVKRASPLTREVPEVFDRFGAHVLAMSGSQYD